MECFLLGCVGTDGSVITETSDTLRERLPIIATPDCPGPDDNTNREEPLRRVLIRNFASPLLT